MIINSLELKVNDGEYHRFDEVALLIYRNKTLDPFEPISLGDHPEGPRQCISPHEDANFSSETKDREENRVMSEIGIEFKFKDENLEWWSYYPVLTLTVLYFFKSHPTPIPLFLPSPPHTPHNIQCMHSFSGDGFAHFHATQTLLFLI